MNVVDLIQQEGMRYEAKRCESHLPKEFWKTYSAFANTFGGRIVLGLSEDSENSTELIATGVNDPEGIVQEIWNLANNKEKVSINLLNDMDVRIETYEGKRLIIVDVPRAERRKRPVFLNNNMNSGTYRRNGEGDYLCGIDEIREMVRDSVDETYDMTLCSTLLLKDFDADTVESYRNMLRQFKPAHPWNSAPNDEFLRLIGAAKEDHGRLIPTIAGALMFAVDYSIIGEINGYSLDFMDCTDGPEWSDRLKTGTGEWPGNVFDFITRIFPKIYASAPKPFLLKDGVRVDDNDYSKALRELVLNSLVHADYRGIGGIRVTLGTNCLTASNPGMFRIPVAKAMKGGLSDPRNPGLMRMLMLVGYIENAGSGLYRVTRACDEMGFAPPEISEEIDPSRVVMTVRSVPVKTAHSTDEDVLNYLSCHKTATIAEISSYFGISTSTVMRTINKLRSKGVLRRDGSKRNGTWTVRRRLESCHELYHEYDVPCHVLYHICSGQLLEPFTKTVSGTIHSRIDLLSPYILKPT